MDYNLHSLSSRSFEHLVQALAAKYIGPKTVIFGDGPDGAREATYDGKSIYQGATGVWEGYIVVQAKFRQIPRDDDGKWLYEQLNTELKKFKDRGLRAPQYYLLATNIKLTPVHKTGSKDKLTQLLDEFRVSSKMSEFDIWDYDKIRVFLDESRDIATTYMAWIAPGDVLAAVFSHLKGLSPEFQATLANFLQKELIADQFARLEQAGRASAERVPLASVFVDLTARQDARHIAPSDSSESESGFIKYLLQMSRERLDAESRERALSAEQSKLRRGPNSGRLVLVGGPGQGKSTVTQYICQLFRSAILNERPKLQVTPEAAAAIRIIEQQSRLEKLDLPGIRRFPVRIALNELAAALSRGETSSLLQYICSKISKRTNIPIELADLKSWLKVYPWFVVLDGLDEVPSSSNRAETVSAINDFLVDVSDLNADIMVLSTTRPQGYSKEFSPEHYEHWYLTPLSTQRALQYGTRLITMRYAEDQDRRQLLQERLRAAAHDRTTARLMRSPLQVTIMATLVSRMGKPPEEVWSLFKEYYQVIYHREAEKASSHTSLLHDQRTNIDIIHNRVALLLQVESELSAGSTAKLDFKRFTQLLSDRLDEQGFNPKQKLALQTAILQAATERLVFISALEADQVGFDIRPLQEFFANEALMTGTDDDLRARLKLIGSLPYWRNVFIFSAGRCLVDRDYLWDSIHALCFELNSRSDRILHSTKAGSQLAVDLLSDGPIRRHPKYCDSLLKLAFEILDLPTEDWHSRIASLYSDDSQEIFEEELTKRLISGVSNSRINAQLCLAEIAERKESWAIKRWDELVHNENLAPQDVEVLLRRVPSRYSVFASILSLAGFISVFAARQSLEDNAGAPGTPTKRKLPPWASALTGSHFGSETPTFHAYFRSPNSQSDHFGVALIAVKHGVDFTIIPFRTKTWDMLAKVGEFCRDPTPATLSKALVHISTSEECDVLQLNDFPLPWPLKACIKGLNSKEELKELSAAVSAKELGTREDWEKAEQRWLEKGIEFDDLKYASQLKNRPFTKEIGKIGVPASACEILTYSGKPTVDINQLLTLFNDLRPSFASALAAAWALYQLEFAEEHGVSNEVICDFILATRIFGWPVDVSELAGVLDLRILNESSLDKLDELGRTTSLFMGGDAPTSSSLALKLQSAFLLNPRRIGLLNVMEALDSESVIRDIPRILLREHQGGSIPVRAAASRLALHHSSWTHEQAEQAGQDFCFAAVDTGDIAIYAYQFMQIANALAISPDVQERIATSMLANSSPGSPTEREAIRISNRLLRQRQSGLTSKAIWENLALPKGLHQLITAEAQ